jgi:soluble lytic murein transglycosylase-like protein
LGSKKGTGTIKQPTGARLRKIRIKTLAIKMSACVVIVVATIFVFYSETDSLASQTDQVVSTSTIIKSYIYLIQRLNSNVPFLEAQKIALAVDRAVDETRISGYLIICLMKTESNFNKHAISYKFYKGLMQTPGYTGYIDIDVLWGARILQEKLEMTHYDLRKALALYKGGNNRLARRQASEVLKLWKRVSKEI